MERTTKEEAIKTLEYEIDKETGCHIVIPQKNVLIEKDNGYALCGCSDGLVRAHKLSYQFYQMNIYPWELVRHTCDNRLCINPKHLKLGSKKDNSRDMVDRGRSAGWEDRPVKPNGKHSIYKLSREQIIEIKNSDKSSYQLAKVYNVSSTQIRRIKNGTRCNSIK